MKDKINSKIKSNITLASLFFVSFFALFGCANLSPAPNKAIAIYKNFNKNHWLADGKMAIRYPDCRRKGDCEEEAVSAGLEWEHRGRAERLVLLDPLGREHMKIQYANGQVHIVEGKREKTASLSELVDKIGVPLPLDSLSKWLTTKQPANVFVADGWKITVSDWNGAFYKRMKLEQKQYFLHIIIKNMQSFQ